MNGIIYYKLTPSNYYPNMIGYDFTKNSSLVGSEIDSNFHFLEGQDFFSMQMNGTYLELTRVNGTTEKVMLTPYTEGCGIEITPDNEINLRFKEDGGISCFNGDLYIPRGCGIGIEKEEESCEGFNLFLEKMLGQETATNYINTLIPINGEFYGGRIQPTNCDTPFCMDDQFYNDYLNYLRSGKLSLDVCGIECDKEGNARIAVDEETLELDENCVLKVNYGCGLEVHEKPTENDYINFLEENWVNLPGTQGVSLECYLDKTETVNNQYYSDNGDDFYNDQFYSKFEDVFKPTLNVNLDEYGGLMCGPSGIKIDCGCGLTTNTSPDYNEFCQYMQILAPDVSFDETNWQSVQPFYNSYLNYINSGALSISTANGGGISCVGGNIRVNLGCLLETEHLIQCCEISEELNEQYYSYERFLSENWDDLTLRLQNVNSQVQFLSYWNGSEKIGCEYFGGNSCSALVCNNCSVYFYDQFFNDYLSFIIGGRIKVQNCQGGGGGGEQSDWNENNPTAPSYVKNRTHWEEENYIQVILPESPTLPNHYNSNAVDTVGNFIYQNVTINNQAFLNYLDTLSGRGRTEAFLNILSYLGAGVSSSNHTMLFDSDNKPGLATNSDFNAINTALADMDSSLPDGLPPDPYFGGTCPISFIGNYQKYMEFVCKYNNYTTSQTNQVISSLQSYVSGYGGNLGSGDFCVLPYTSDTYVIVYDYTNDTGIQSAISSSIPVYYYYNLEAEETVSGIHELEQKYYNHDFTWVVEDGTTVTFDKKTRGSEVIFATDNIALNIIVKNNSDNFIYIANSKENMEDCTVVINSVVDSSGNDCVIFRPNEQITIPFEKVGVIRIVVDNLEEPSFEIHTVSDVVEGSSSISVVLNALDENTNNDPVVENSGGEETQKNVNMAHAAFITYMGYLTGQRKTSSNSSISAHNSAIDSVESDIVGQL